MCRDIFGDDTLPLDQSLEIGSATVVFTDITGSTALYERLGDARAYRLIRDHFDLVFNAIAEYEGVPIKTIGDAVMGVFTNEAAAIRAVFAITDALARNNSERDDGERLELKGISGTAEVYRVALPLLDRKRLQRREPIEPH